MFVEVLSDARTWSDLSRCKDDKFDILVAAVATPDDDSLADKNVNTTE